MSKLIDFDEEFNKYIEKWAKEELASGKDAETIEDGIGEAYEKWAEKAIKNFDGLSVEELCEMLMQYMVSDISVPDILSQKISQMPNADKALLLLMQKGTWQSEQLILLINILSEMKSMLPTDYYISLISSPDTDEDIASAAADALKYMGGAAEKVLAAFDDEEDVFVKEQLMYVLVYGKNRTDGLAGRLSRLMNVSGHKAFTAGLISEYGDNECLDALYCAETADEIDYIDYTEICNAIESLGGETERNRDFEGDAYYDMLKNRDVL